MSKAAKVVSMIKEPLGIILKGIEIYRDWTDKTDSWAKTKKADVERKKKACRLKYGRSRQRCEKKKV
jgi:hypothetical protein